MPKEKAKSPQLIYLLSDVSITQPTTDTETVRTFDSVANSGKPFVYYGQRSIVDLTAIQSNQITPALVNHDRDQIAGYGQVKVENNQLLMSGTLVTDDDDYKGDYVAKLADKKFPWQMSAHIEASRVEEVLAGQTVTVNNQDITGPIFILRDCRVVEVSFTPTGVDYETSAVVLSATGTATPDKPITPTQKDNTMTLDEALAKIKELETLEEEKAKRIKELEDENAKLKETENKAQVDAQLSQAGFTKAEDGNWSGLSAGTYNMLLSATADNAKAMIGDLKLSQGNQAPAHNTAKPPLPNVLLGEQYPQGGQQGMQLSNSPLVADAQARIKQAVNYI